MKAVQINRYTKAIEVQVNQVEKPTVLPNEVLIQVNYAAINPLDLMYIHGSIKLLQTYSMPFTLGNEVSGTIVSVGTAVKDFAIGDRVYSRLPLEKIGGFAEYVAVNQDDIWYVPSHLSLKEAVAIPLTGLTAYQGLVEELHAEAGKTLFIPGGSGSFGQIAVPLAKSMGLKVIVSGNAAAQAHILELGADQYIDYKATNYWEVLQDVDYVIDTRGGKELEHELSIMKPGGRLLSLIAGPNKAFAQFNKMPAWKTLLFGLVGHKLDKLARQHQAEYRFIFVRADGNQLKKVTEIVEQKQIVPAIDPHVFDLDHVQDGLELLANGHTVGKVVVTVHAEN